MFWRKAVESKWQVALAPEAPTNRHGITALLDGTDRKVVLPMGRESNGPNLLRQPNALSRYAIIPLAACCPFRKKATAGQEFPSRSCNWQIWHHRGSVTKPPGFHVPSNAGRWLQLVPVVDARSGHGILQICVVNCTIRWNERVRIGPWPAWFLLPGCTRHWC